MKFESDQGRESSTRRFRARPALATVLASPAGAQRSHGFSISFVATIAATASRCAGLFCGQSACFGNLCPGLASFERDSRAEHEREPEPEAL